MFDGDYGNSLIADIIFGLYAIYIASHWWNVIFR
ncbi:MAG: hypothetical protein FKGGLIKP_00866 [Sodalis sp. Fse]|nr:MAG: hypothetical protein FKGGLIKP_00866 [Sodalis sp. Fse]UVK79140.1 MAG: hypothetical protein IGNPGNKH_00622 [Sodalis sp. Ffu]